MYVCVYVCLTFVCLTSLFVCLFVSLDDHFTREDDGLYCIIHECMCASKWMYSAVYLRVSKRVRVCVCGIWNGIK